MKTIKRILITLLSATMLLTAAATVCSAASAEDNAITVKVDGEVLDEPYIAEKTKRQFDVQFPATVPENCVFVMGDNRMHSSDSRVSSLGMVDEDYILGRLLIRIYPFNQIGPVD